MAKSKTVESPEIQVATVQTGTIRVRVIGNTPIVLNRMSEKAKHELLLPRGRMNAAQKQQNLKHDPVTEFRASATHLPEGPTLLGIDATAFKGSLMTAALDLPGTKKAQIGRLSYVNGRYVGIYGLPMLYMAVVRSSDMNRTPDIRTRCIIPNWCAEFEVTFIKPHLTPEAICNLLAAAGLYIGVGDGRPEKGKMTFGQFHIVATDEDEKLYETIVAQGSREQQVFAMAEATPYDDETEELLSWFNTELGNRRFKAETANTRKAAAAGVETEVEEDE